MATSKSKSKPALSPDTAKAHLDARDGLTFAKSQISFLQATLYDETGHQVELDGEAMSGLYCILGGIEGSIGSIADTLELCSNEIRAAGVE